MKQFALFVTRLGIKRVCERLVFWYSAENIVNSRRKIFTVNEDIVFRSE